METDQLFYFVKQSPNIACVLRDKAQIESASPAFEELYRWRDLAQPPNFYELFRHHNPHLQSLLENIFNQTALHNVPPQQFTTHVENQHQSLITLVWRVKPLKLKSISYFWLTAETKETHHSVVPHLDRLLDDVGKISHTGHWQLHIASEQLHWSEEIYRIHGVSPKTYNPDVKSALDFYHPEDVNQVQDYLTQSLKQGKEWNFRLRIVRPDGEIRHVASSVNVLTNQQGPEYLFGVFQDITEYVELEQQKDLLACAVEHSTAGIVITDAERKVVWANHGFETLTGYALPEVEKHNLATFLQGEETDQETVAYMKEELGAGRAIDVEIFNYHKSGSTYWNRLIITPIYHHSKLQHFVGVQHNITAEKLAQQQLQELYIKLEEKVKQRTEALNRANQELQKLANRDPLTNAHNRRSFQHIISLELKRADRHEHILSLAIIDIDWFKRINDNFGHDSGDKVLVALVECISNELREIDTLFRFGGEEFVLLMPETPLQDAGVVVERLRHIVEQQQVQVKGTELKFTISIGVSCHVPGEPLNTLLKNADEAMYEAKFKGRNKSVVKFPQHK